MTHTLHRLGTPESLGDDYIVLCDGDGASGTETSLNRVLELAKGSAAVNIGCQRGESESTLYTVGKERLDRSCLSDSAAVRCVYTDVSAVESLIESMLREDLDLSVMVEGLLSEIFKMCDRLELKPHAAVVSLGVFGRTDLLPPEDMLDVATMCGHGRITAEFVERIFENVRSGKTSPAQASEQLAKICVDAAFNPHRAARILSGKRSTSPQSLL